MAKEKDFEQRAIVKKDSALCKKLEEKSLGNSIEKLKRAEEFIVICNDGKSTMCHSSIGNPLRMLGALEKMRKNLLASIRDTVTQDFSKKESDELMEHIEKSINRFRKEE